MVSVMGYVICVVEDAVVLTGRSGMDFKSVMERHDKIK